MPEKIVVIGSSNTDMVIVTDHFPLPGETILGGEFLMNPGGKGANQAVAAARLGGNVAFISKVGKDIFGEQTIINLKKEGIDVSSVAVDLNKPSGVAMITVDSKAENSIVVAPGANMKMIISAPVVTALDTTAAGDTFSGALAVSLSKGEDIIKAVNFANRAAAKAVTRLGAQSSIPFLKEIS